MCPRVSDVCEVCDPDRRSLHEIRRLGRVWGWTRPDRRRQDTLTKSPKWWFPRDLKGSIPRQEITLETEVTLYRGWT